MRRAPCGGGINAIATRSGYSPGPMSDSITRLYQGVLACRHDDPSTSRTARLLRSGRSKIGDTEFEWRKNDVFVAPSWCPVSHEANGEAVLFSFSDRPVQKVLGLWREEIIHN